ncbi:MAG TPA: hypothetical protein VL359_02300, partial [bacterium]|nr:hypothetical protein [bacterium]
ADFHAHFPLFISEESVVLVLGEMLFVPPVRELLHLAVLVEVTPGETARRLFELPEHEPFDPKFTTQYMEKEGARYRGYLERNAVREGADLHVDGNVPLAFRLADLPVGTN